jgi:foldase protein PrsA
MLASVSRRAHRFVTIVVVAVSVAAAASADGLAESTVPANAVAVVGDRAITHATFRHWLNVAAAPTQRGPRIYYHPPSFTSCVKIKRTTERGATARLRAKCRAAYEGLRDQVLQFLILESWVTQETLERGTGPTDAELETAFQKAKHDTFPKESDFRKFLKAAGMTVEDARFQVAFNTRYTALREAAIASAPPVTDEDVATYYKQHKRQFFQTQRRDVRLVLTSTRARAYAALAALRRGVFWQRVAEEYSTDQASKHRGGIVRGITKGMQERPFDDALFRAPKDALRGPVKTHVGYFVFRVFEIHPARQLTLAQASESIRSELGAQRQRAADETFNEDFRTKWRARTTCGDGFLMDQCSNGPPLQPDSADAD